MVNSSGEEEHRRVLGFPISAWPRWQPGKESPGEEEYQRFMGFPISFFPRLQPGQQSPHAERHRSGSNFSSLWHPVDWIRWRIALRRRGPFTPGFEEFRRGPRPGTG